MKKEQRGSAKAKNQEEQESEIENGEEAMGRIDAGGAGRAGGERCHGPSRGCTMVPCAFSWPEQQVPERSKRNNGRNGESNEEEEAPELLLAVGVRR